MSTPKIDWQAKHRVYVNREFSIALVKVRGGYVELDDYRGDGGNTLSELPAYSEELGAFTNAEISNMAYPS